IGLGINIFVFILLGTEQCRADFVIAHIERANRTAVEVKTALSAVPAEPAAAKPDPILVADNMVKTFGGLTAVDVDHVEIERGSITALIGPNGAGKTTFFNLITGFDKPDKGGSWV